jgi:hypothetical protein
MSTLIIRPGLRALQIQLLVGLLLAVSLGCAYAFFGDTPSQHPVVFVAIAVAYGAAAAAHYLWLRARAPRAIVATFDYVGVLQHNGAHTRVPWSSITAANHGIDAGMRWELLLTGGDRLILSDVGIDSARWGLLWVRIVRHAANSGAEVRVDPMSNMLYSGLEGGDTA